MLLNTFVCLEREQNGNVAVFMIDDTEQSNTIVANESDSKDHG